MGTATITEWDLAKGTAAESGVDLTVDFDPKSLQLSYNPTGATSAAAVTESGTWSKTAPQQTGQSTTLTVDLTFDTSTTGDSVQQKTDQLVGLTLPPPLGESAPARRVVRFSWGSFLFFGTVQTMSQTIDFFSDDGVPLRAAVHVTLSQVSPPNPEAASPAATPPTGFGANAGIAASASFGASAGVGASFSAGASVGTTALTLSQAGDTVQAITARAGAGVSWKAIAAANGIDNPRLLPPGTILDASARINLS
jgi:hypothetical protein